jgi:hypothetical protein
MAAPDFDEAQAARFARMALDCVHKEYPNKIAHSMNSDADLKPPHELTPAFYGCYDWHSSVHGHWLLVRLVRLFPQAPFAAEARKALAQSLTPANIAREVAYLNAEGRVAFERPYGLAWLMQLAAELKEWDNPQAKQWSATLAPLEKAAVARISEWLPKLDNPIRVGEHNNTAFSMSLMLDYARIVGNAEFGKLIEQRARRYYLQDRGCPVNYEPSGEDFLSPCLAEADLMRRVMPAGQFGIWFRVLIGRLEFEPTTVVDPSDPKLYPLAGLNLSRAWMIEGILSVISASDGRGAAMADLAARLRKAGLASIKSEQYAGGHWLGTFAVYLVTGRGMK